MGAIFISYRRDDTEGQSGRLFQELRLAFGAENVFMDVATIEPGADFRRVIEKNTAACGVLLSVIGRNWLTLADARGQRRLDDPNDFVRLETAAALRRDIPVIPVLVQGTPMPRAEELPEDLRELAYRNSVELTHARWDSDVQLLVAALKKLLARAPGAAPGPAAVAPAAGAVLQVPATPAAASRHSVPWRWLAVGGSVAALALALALALGSWLMLRQPALEAEREAEPRRQAQIRAHYGGICRNGFVWREARPGDKVCVTPEVRSRTVTENQAVASTRSPTGGAYGPDTCKSGYVWRESRADDVVCVVPSSRQQAANDNALGRQRVVPLPG
ncbi:MAG: toll/interleukin-1 receptor domain-containing protein [Rubrivivax sp.]|nr:toll/interleukin-1 receptor domain-containing protein [Rubrivivax sp.]